MDGVTTAFEFLLQVPRNYVHGLNQVHGCHFLRDHEFVNDSLTVDAAGCSKCMSRNFL